MCTWQRIGPYSKDKSVIFLVVVSGIKIFFLLFLVESKLWNLTPNEHMCIYWAYGNLGENILWSLITKRRFFNVLIILRRNFPFTTVVNNLLIQILQYASANLSNVVRFWIKNLLLALPCPRSGAGLFFFFFFTKHQNVLHQFLFASSVIMPISQTWYPLVTSPTWGQLSSSGHRSQIGHFHQKCYFFFRLQGMVMWLMHVHQLDTLYKSY